jgi:hypothetical protein
VPPPVRPDLTTYRPGGWAPFLREGGEAPGRGTESAARTLLAARENVPQEESGRATETCMLRRRKVTVMIRGGKLVGRIGGGVLTPDEMIQMFGKKECEALQEGMNSSAKKNGSSARHVQLTQVARGWKFPPRPEIYLRKGMLADPSRGQSATLDAVREKVLRGSATKRDTVQLFAPSGAAPTNQVVASSRAVVRASWVDEKPWKNVAPRGFWS